MSRHAVIVLPLTLLSCHETTTPKIDASCWSLEGTSPAGTVEIGTADMDEHFLPLPSRPVLDFDTQLGYHLALHLRMKGLNPGSPGNFMDPSNPKTKLTATLMDGTKLGSECPATLGYVPSPDGWFQRLHPLNLAIPPDDVAKIVNTTVTLTAEVIDVEHHYARNDQNVFVVGLDAASGGADITGSHDGSVPLDGGVASD
jgi:hypothetical protein